MASIRKFRGKFNVQIRRQGYPSISRTFANLTTAKRWASATEADMERNLHVVIPDNTTVGELLGRYEEEISATHKSHQVEKYRLQTLREHLGDKRVSALLPVRHQSFWVQSSFNLREYLAHLVCHIMRRTCGVASAESRVFCV